MTFLINYYEDLPAFVTLSSVHANQYSELKVLTRGLSGEILWGRWAPYEVVPNDNLKDTPQFSLAYCIRLMRVGLTGRDFRF